MNTEGNKYQEQSLFSLSWPLFIELALHMGMGIIATLMLSHFSDDAVAGVGVANQLINIFLLVFSVTSVGAIILIGQRLGANQLSEARKLARAAFGVNFWIGAVISLIVIFFGGYFLRLFDIHGQIYQYGLTFVRICGFSLLFESLSQVLSAVLRSHGYTKEAMSVTILMDVISIVGNILAITGIFGLPKTGVTGVSWAMVAARAFAVCALLFLVYSRLSLKMKISDIFIFSKENIHGILSIGIPSAGENLSYQFSQLVITAFVAALGASSLAARVYILNISMVCYLFTVAIAQGTQMLIARYVGGNLYDRALNRGIKTLKLAMLASFITSLLIASIGSPILKLFTDNQAIINVGLPVLWAIVFIEPGRALNIVLMGSLKSAGDVKFPVFIGIFSMWTVAAFLSYILGIQFGLGLVGIWIAQGMDEWFRGIFALKRWLSKPWERKVKIRANHQMEGS